MIFARKLSTYVTGNQILATGNPNKNRNENNTTPTGLENNRNENTNNGKTNKWGWW